MLIGIGVAIFLFGGISAGTVLFGLLFAGGIFGG